MDYIQDLEQIKAGKHEFVDTKVSLITQCS